MSNIEPIVPKVDEDGLPIPTFMAAFEEEFEARGGDNPPTEVTTPEASTPDLSAVETPPEAPNVDTSTETASVEAPSTPSYGNFSTAEEAQQAQEILAWARNLPPQQSAQIDDLLNGRVVAVPAADYNRLFTPQETVKLDVAPAASFTADELEMLDPAIVARIQAQDARLAEFDQRIASHDRVALQQSQADVTVAANNAIAAFRDHYQLDEATADRVAQAAANSQTVQIHIDRAGDTTRGFIAALETTMFSDPTLRDEYLGRQLSVKRAEEINKEAMDDVSERIAAKKAAASTVGANSGASNRNPVPSKLNKADRESAMIADLAQLMGQ
jgi:hypothetical protein